MKIRMIIWGAGIGVIVVSILLFSRYHFVARPWRAPDKIVEMKTTGYCACGRCCGWTRTWYGKPVVNYGSQKGVRKKVGKTFSGPQARPGTVAVDRSRFPMGTRFYIPGYGWGIAQDIGGAVEHDHLDLFHWFHGNARAWGVQTLQVKVWLPKK